MPETDLSLLLDAARAAGKIALRHFRESPDHWDKGDGAGPVSVADIEIDRMLRAELTAARPDYGWLSEETEDDKARLSAPRVFVVDPIDGTRAFLQGHENFGHSLAVVENGRTIAGVVHMPARGETFAAVAGGGATLNGRPLRATARAEVEGARVLAAKPQLAPDRWPGGVPPVERHFRASLAYRLALVASGAFDAMITLRDCWEWDIAAGALICSEAGATVAGRDGRALAFNSPGRMTPGAIAGSGPLVQALVDRLRLPFGGHRP